MILSLFQTLRGEKKKFFKKKMRDVQYSIWDAEFKVAKSRQVREGVRGDRDRTIEAIRMVDARLADPNTTAEDKAKYEADKAAMQENAARYERQMAMIDAEVNGVPYKDPENPGQQGILEYIAGYTQLMSMLKEEYNNI